MNIWCGNIHFNGGLKKKKLDYINPFWSILGYVWQYVKCFPSVENILCKGKHFLLYDCVVEITLENYFLCLVLVVKNLFSENGNTNQLPTTTTRDKHNTPPPTQNPDREEGKNCHHCSIAITTTTTTQNTPPPTPNTTTTKSKIKENKNQWMKADRWGRNGWQKGRERS